MNHLTNLSEHFSLAELTKTNTGIENVPNEAQVENLRRVCRWLERLRKRWNDLYGDGDDPIIINSGFRSAAVNKAVGGVPTSNHLTGCAVDIRCIGMEQALRAVMDFFFDEVGANRIESRHDPRNPHSGIG